MNIRYFRILLMSGLFLSHIAQAQFDFFKSTSEEDNEKKEEKHQDQNILLSPISVAVKVGDFRLSTDEDDQDAVEVASSRNAIFQVAYQFEFDKTFYYSLMYEYAKTHFYPKNIGATPVWSEPLEYQAHGIYGSIRTKSAVYGFAKLGGVLANTTEYLLDETSEEDQSYHIAYGLGVGYAITNQFAIEYEYQLLSTDIKIGSLVGRYRF